MLFLWRPSFSLRSLFLSVLMLGSLLSGCALIPDPQPPASNLPSMPFLLVTVAPNAAATPTPFQPITPTPFPPGFLTFYQSPSLPTPTPLPSSPTPTPLPPTPTPLPTLNPSWQPTPIPPLDQVDNIRFLLLGSDRRPGGSFRTDTMIVVTFWPRQRQVSLLSIPRDLWVSIPTWGMQRINTAYQHGELSGYPGGGAALLKDTLRENLGIAIDHVAMVEFDGFKRIIDTLGGIDVPVACAYTDWRLIDPQLDPNDERNWWLYTIGPGYVHMDGDLALWYARSRLRSNDFDRGRRQQEVLRAIYARLLQANVLPQLPALYAEFSKTVTTDLTLNDLLQLSVYAPQLNNARIRSYAIRPPYVTPTIGQGGAYLLLPNPPLLSELLNEALNPSDVLSQRESVVVQVENGTPWEGWEMLVSSRLNYAGFEARLAPPERRDVRQTLLVDYTAEQNAAQRQLLLQVLGLDPSRLISQPLNSPPVAYRLILGLDYQPCFQPQDLP